MKLQDKLDVDSQHEQVVVTANGPSVPLFIIDTHLFENVIDGSIDRFAE